MTDYSIKNMVLDENPDVFKFLDKMLAYGYSKGIYDWEYLHNKGFLFYLLNPNNEVVGAQGMIPIKLRTAKEILETAKSETSYLDSSTQGKGLFREIYNYNIDECKSQNICTIWGFTALGPLWKKLGFKVQNECLFTSTLPINTKQKGNGFLDSVKHQLKNMFRRVTFLKEGIKFNVVRNNNLDFVKSVEFNNKITDFNRSLFLKAANLVNIDYNQAYVDYRFIDNPFMVYEYYYLFNADKDLVAYAITSHSKNEDKFKYNLVDIKGNNRVQLETLIHHLISELRCNHKGIELNFFASTLKPENKAVFKQLKKYGATSYDSEMFIVGLDLTENKSQNMEFENWYINGVWTQGTTI